MERENEGTHQKIMKRLKSTLLILRRVLIFIGLCGCFQLLVVGLIGVARGYSVQGFWSEWIAIASVFCLLFLAHRKNVILYIIIFTIMYSSLVGIAQSRYKKPGKEYYEQGRYQQALEEFKKETETWYLRLQCNHNEDSAMEMMAKTYCQLQDFDKARETYKLIMRRYPGFSGGRAEEYLADIEDGLKVVAKYPDQLSNAKGFPSDLYDIARTYQYDLNCSIKALEVYRKIVDMDIGESTKELARKSIEELTVVTQK